MADVFEAFGFQSAFRLANVLWLTDLRHLDSNEEAFRPENVIWLIDLRLLHSISIQTSKCDLAVRFEVFGFNEHSDLKM